MTAPAHSRGRYSLSFTSGALLTREALIAVPLYLTHYDWSLVTDQLRTGNMFQARTASSALRLGREVTQRLAVLTDPELELLQDAVPSERGHLMWVAACRRYTFIGDFAEEVVRERFLLLTPTLDYTDFDSFVHGKTLWHSELAALKQTTLLKLRSTLFRMLIEAGLLAHGEIVAASPSERVRDALDAQQPSDVRFLPTRLPMENAL